MAAVIANCGSAAQKVTDGGGTDTTGGEDGASAGDVGEPATKDASATDDGAMTDRDLNVDLGPRPTPLRWVKEASGILARTIGGTGPNDIWVVGDGGKAWHSVGDGGWTQRFADTAGRITGVWGTAPDNVYASLLINLVLRWNGTMWERQTNGIPIGATFKTIWGSGPNDIYIADAALFHSAGNGVWEGIKLPLTVGPFLGIWGTGPNDVWVLADNGVARKSDGTWTVERTGRPIGSQAIWGSGSTDIYVVYGGAILHTVGDRIWTEQTVDTAPLEGLRSIWGSGADDIYVGSTDSLFHSLGNGRWHREMLDPENPVADVFAIWGTSRTNVYVYAGDGIYHGQ